MKVMDLESMMVHIVRWSLEDDEVVDESESHDDQHSYQLEDINNNGNDSIIMDTHLNYWLICHYS